ncbi:multidrug efflux RND transporter permease subunit [Verrucomicrobiaceae bacterium 5K15]|uniref:Multidrug efflux RND transporter permease subunit n=1 Tax=Oceaniferula flava TaxID=2800421 RepID=A0AAE2VAH9_9BACT|nr:multidrug efflux RND transporter permease subunit [Oceaniferula flavus]MBK1853335.1 multidrug efflux RND transporter permease subunit [Oceaniferula flavus]MBM1134640.1 multidrug efflux RND transporter permease subunit [Oceaniferula flavus]
MKLPQFFIDRPIFASVISIVIMLVGGIAYLTLPVAQYPEIAPPTIQVTASYPGASPDVLAETVSTPLEQEINGVEKMIYMTSQSTSNGAVTITVSFEQGTDVDEAQVLVQNRVSRALPKLPELVQRTGVVTEKASPDLLLVAHLIADDGELSQLFVGNYAYLRVRDELLRLNGVGNVTVFGASEYSMRVWLDPQKLAARNLTSGDVLAALSEQNVQVAAGTIGKQPMDQSMAFEMSVLAKGRLKDAEEFEQIIVKTGDSGQIVHLGEVARIELGSQDYSRESYLDGKPAIGIGVTQKPGSNALETAQEVEDTLERLSQDFPVGLSHTIVYNPTVFVEESINSVYHTLIEAVCLVVIVILVFLQNWRASLIPLLAIPVSLIGALGVMAAMDFSLNNLTLFGLVLAIGIVVDDAIVVVEGVERHLEEGLSPKDATSLAMKEVSGALVSMALVLCAVFVPTAFITGISGQFYQQFAITIAVATVISAFVSLTLSPAMCAILLRSPDAKKDWFQKGADLIFGWFFRLFNRFFNKLSNVYGGIVKRVTRFAVLMLLLYFGLVGLGGFTFTKVPSGFIPTQDQGYLILSIQLPPAASLSRTRDVVKEAGEIARGIDGVGHTVEIAGFSGATRSIASNAAAIFVILDPFDERTASGRNSAVISADLKKALAPVTESNNVVIAPPPVRGIGTGGGFKLMLQSQANGSYDELEKVTQEFLMKVNKDPSTAYAFTTFSAQTPQYYADIDRDKAKMMNVPMSNVFETLQVALGSSYVNDFNQFGRSYRVIAQAESQYRDQESDVRLLSTRNSDGKIVPLGSLVKMNRVTGPDRVVRHNLYPTAEIIGITAPGVSSGDSLDAVEKLAEQLPPGYTFAWIDIAYQERAAGNTAALVFALAVVFVFLLLAAQYESWGLPMAVILIVPMCLFSAIAGVMLREMDNNILTQIGFVVLIGLAAKNAILIVEFARQQEDDGKDRFEAAIEACRLRLRPILMTSFAFILGVVPLVISTGPGAEMRQSLGTAVFAGMLGVTFFGLIFTPVFYVLVRGMFQKRRDRQALEAKS